MSANKVFGCDDLRRKILSFLPKYCLGCKDRMGNINFPFNYKPYYNRIWCKNECKKECKKNKGYCNYCYYYVYDYI
jgi:hypothetical protein